MKKKLALLCIASLLGGYWGFREMPQSRNVTRKVPTDQTTVASTSSLIKATPEEAQQLREINGLSEKDSVYQPGTGLLEIDRPADKLKMVPSAETMDNKIYQAMMTPNDPIYPQWYTDKVSAPQAWDVSTGSTSITVAVVDTGFALDHEDLVGRWAVNGGEVGDGKESNGIDDDGNDYIDDWRGWDFTQNDNNPNAGSVNPNGAFVVHGTMTSGLVGATGNNGIGVASLDWNARILPIQALDDDGVGYTSTVAAAVNYAVSRGVNVISLSLGSSSDDPALQSQISYAISQGIVVVAAAGNSGTQWCGCMVYPANYPEVIAVGATDSSDNKASFSSYGPNLDVVAPGTGTIRTTYWSQANQTSAYTGSASGTSISTPIVAGLVGLLKAHSPALSTGQISSLITLGTDRVAGMGSSSFTNEYGYGRINTYKTLTNAAYMASSGVIPVFRMANYISKERLFTTNAVERDNINGRNGWVYEGVGFNATPAGVIPVYRLANYITKERLFTTDAREKDFINGRDGWVYEGVAFLMDSSGNITVYRMANYISKERLFTVSAQERDHINGRNGWVYEDVAFFAK